MANKNDKPIWLNLEFDLETEFDRGSFEELMKYANSNELHLMRIWLSGNPSNIRKTLRLGTLLLNFFEDTISEDLKSLSAFKLGELSGHLECLNRILYETDQKDLAKGKLETIKSMYPEYSHYFDNIIVVLFSNENVSILEQELLKKIPLSIQELKKVLDVMVQNALINYYENIGYSLSDTGYQLAQSIAEKS